VIKLLYTDPALIPLSDTRFGSGVQVMDEDGGRVSYLSACRDPHQEGTDHRVDHVLNGLRGTTDITPIRS
jgi:hypothetical protein